MIRWLGRAFRRENTAFFTLFTLYFTMLFSHSVTSMPAQTDIRQDKQPNGGAIQVQVDENFTRLENISGATDVCSDTSTANF